MPLYPEVLPGEAHFPPFAQACPPSWGLLVGGGPEHLGLVCATISLGLHEASPTAEAQSSPVRPRKYVSPV